MNKITIRHCANDDNTNSFSKLDCNVNSVYRCSQIIKWKAPCAPWIKIKINFNGSMVGSHVVASFVIRNHNGSLNVVGTRILGENTIFVAEAIYVMCWSLQKSKILNMYVLKVIPNTLLIQFWTSTEHLGHQIQGHQTTCMIIFLYFLGSCLSEGEFSC